MKAVLLVFMLGCHATSAFGQTCAIHLPKEQQSDTTSFWYKWTVKEEQQVDLNPLDKSPYSFHFRLTNGGLMLGIWQKYTFAEIEGRGQHDGAKD